MHRYTHQMSLLCLRLQSLTCLSLLCIILGYIILNPLCGYWQTEEQNKNITQKETNNINTGPIPFLTKCLTQLKHNSIFCINAKGGVRNRLCSLFESFTSLPEHNLSNGDSMIMSHLLQCNKGWYICRVACYGLKQSSSVVKICKDNFK